MIETRHEADRLESLRSYGVLDTPPEKEYDALTAEEAVTEMCGKLLANPVTEDFEIATVSRA